ncbi:MAG TPA: PGPGW domain-containing protein [Xanthomonadaceae bacterium]|nr:PGPGW domain-containing protein [Xanthomonadaceae bacterium]
MRKWLHQHWQKFSREPAGSRFQARYRRRLLRRRRPVLRYLVLGLGVLLLAAGLAMLVLPGPGLLVLLIGGGLVAEESLVAAAAMDRCEVGIRRLLPGGRSRPQASVEDSGSVP